MRLLGGIGVVFHLQAAGGTHTDATSIHKTQMHMATSFSLYGVAHADDRPPLHGQLPPINGDDMRPPDDQGGLAHYGICDGGVNLRKCCDGQCTQQRSCPEFGCGMSH